MNKQEARQRIEKLKKVINYHRYLYHVLDKQEISDSALDSLKHELFELEEQFPDLGTPDSPTQRVGGRPLDKFNKVEHKIPMLSIEDIFEKQELEKWEDYLKRLLPEQDFEYFCELKIDGFAISLVYEEGILKRAATRGDGKTGEDVTQNIKTIESVPLKIKDSLEVRGEVYMEKRVFDRINEQRERQGESLYANPRNLAAGSIRQLDPRVAGSRDLKFLAYDIVSSDIKCHSEKHKKLADLGFRVDRGKLCKDIDQVINYWKQAARKRGKLPYQVDGVVITVNNNELLDKLGVAGKSPRGVRAFKFAAKQATTKIEDIKIQVGRTGAITPVALLKPVNIEGATITRATLHNKDQIQRLDIRTGDTVIIERAGDVIPAVTEVLKDLRTGKEKKFSFPDKCPRCGSKLVKPEGEVVYRCPNPDCPARKTEYLEHFVSKKAFNIEGLGPKIIKQLIDEGLVSGVEDIFELKKGDLISLERFAEKSADNLIKEIQESKRIPLSRFIFSLGIRHVGEETAIDLANQFQTIDELIEAKPEDLENIKDIGQRVSKSIYNWFKNNKSFVSKLKQKGIKITRPQETTNDLKGKIFVFTGSLGDISRDQAQDIVRKKGGRIANSISKETDFLVVGQDPGSKLDKAEKLKVKVIDKKEFLKLFK